MRKFIGFLLILLVSVWLGIKISHDPGYAYFAYGHWSVEMPIWFLGILLVVLFMLLHLIIETFHGLGSISQKIKFWGEQRRNRKASNYTRRGLLELAEGRWQQAEKLLLKAISSNNAPLINYLAAARAAQEQGEYERRDDYLRQAHESTPGSEIAVGLTQAQLQISHKQLEHSLATLRHLQSMVPHHTYVLKLLKRLYIELHDWRSLLELLPELEKRKVITHMEADSLQKRCYIELMEIAKKGKPGAVDEVWDSMNRKLHKEQSLIQHYAAYLIDHGKGEQAEAILNKALKHEWSSDLVLLYGLAKSENSAKQLDVAEGWLKTHGNSSALLLSLGRLCIDNQLWGKARQYLTDSLELEPLLPAYIELGQLYEHLGEQQNALAAYKQGLQLK